MGIQYACTNLLRRELVRQAATLNGIDFLEVLDDEAVPLQSPRQQTLIVHFLQPNPALTLANLQIKGGVRITPVKCVWAYPGAAVPVPPANTAEQG
jgi:hypothetical protein